MSAGIVSNGANGNASTSTPRKISASTRRFLAGVSSAAAAVAANVEAAPRNEVKLAVVGLRGSGKSALVVRYLTRRFIGEYDPDLEDTYTRVEDDVLVRVMDTADQKDVERHLCWSDCVLLAFAVDSKSSFEAAEIVIKAWNEFNGFEDDEVQDEEKSVERKRSTIVYPDERHKETEMILVATKCDVQLGRRVNNLCPDVQNKRKQF